MGLRRSRFDSQLLGLTEPHYMSHGHLDTSLFFTVPPLDQLDIQLHFCLHKVAGIDVVDASFLESAVRFLNLNIQTFCYDPFVLDISEFPKRIIEIGERCLALPCLANCL